LTPTLAALVLTNLLYLVGAVAAASLVSGLYVLRHRKPKSLESGIESFSRELRALAPEHPSGSDRNHPVSPSAGPPPPALRARTVARGARPRRSSGGSVAVATGRRTGAGARPETAVSRDPDREAEPDTAAVAPPGPVGGGGEPEPSVESGPAVESGAPTSGVTQTGPASPDPAGPAAGGLPSVDAPPPSPEWSGPPDAGGGSVPGGRRG
jgi:hypothetical protein